MTKTLIDPTQDEFALLDIIETEHGRRHQRNDGKLFQLAEENRWYVLATVFGGDVAKNRRAWNGWACGALDDDGRPKLTDDDRATIAEQMDVDVAELSPLSDEERAEVLGLFQGRMGKGAKLPDPNDEISLFNIAFLQPLDFEKRYFPAGAFFSSIHFAAYASFSDSCFAADASFYDCHFASDAYFSSIHFAADAYFSSIHFAADAYFSSIHFAADAYFSSSRFAADAYFSSSHFAADADFSYSHFAAGADFSYSHFAAYADFSSVKMLAQTAFQDAIFKTHVPVFHGADLYSDTVFPTDEPASQNYPPVPKVGEEEQGDVEYMSASEQKRAYNRLRYFMNKNLEIDQELFFHRREMACKEVTEDGFVGWLIWAYGKVSGYGSSIARPLMGLVAIWVVGALLLQFAFASDAKIGIMGDGWSAIGISFSNTFAIFGFGETLLSKFSEDAPKWIKAVSGIQAVLGFVFLFLLGLGIRSRFRLR